MKKRHLFLLLCCCVAGRAFAQPSNDECTSPIVINQNLLNYCSNVGQFTNVGATPSSYGPAACFQNVGSDVWFAFTPTATDVTITVKGATSQTPGGTLKFPQVTLYGGVCGGTLDELECQSAVGNNHIVEAYQGGLFPGTTYLIRVQGRNNNTGTFQLCINNYNPPQEPTSDCPQAAILCDKSPFVVQSVTGAGSNITELNDASCFFNGQGTNFETNSTWFVWTCDQSGPLEITLTPLNIADDLDFVIYRLPNGVGNCTGKQVVRCMASGQSTGVNSAPCLGATGLRAGDPDVSEDAGCSEPGDDAWLSPLDMVSGETYALVVNNFTSTGNGFSIEFGGTGTFLGPKAEFETVPQAVCLGTPVQVIDASTFPLGNITKWNWSFGANVTPATASGPGPHTVQFNTSGNRSVVLTVETDKGCKVTTIHNVLVYPDVEVDTVLAAPDCNGGTNGKIEITNIKMGTPPYQFSWNNGPFGPDNTLSGLPVGVYNLVIRDANNCETELDINVKEKELVVDPDITKPLCFGDDNGIITLNVTNGTAPFQFDWGNGFIPDNSEGGFAAGIYTILGLDAELCKGTYVVTVTDNPPLELELEKIDVVCKGAADGKAFSRPSGGVGNYTYAWTSNQTTQNASELPPGTFTVTVTDGNGCTISGSIILNEPDELTIDLIDVVDLLCAGVPTGEIRVEGDGGIEPYLFGVDRRKYNPGDTLAGLLAGDYWVYIRDANGCIDSVFATLTQPPLLAVFAEPAEITLGLGEQINIQTVTAPTGRTVDYSWLPPTYLSCPDCPEPIATAVNSINYIVKITDEDGCMAFDTVKILVDKQRPIYFPNIFAPASNDFNNSHFTGYASAAGLQMNLLRIYDRWGSLVFEARDIPFNQPNLGWDGTVKGKAVSGVFTFYASVRFVDQVEEVYEGNVTVYR
jgi:hypothetical protein